MSKTHIKYVPIISIICFIVLAVAISGSSEELAGNLPYQAHGAEQKGLSELIHSDDNLVDIQINGEPFIVASSAMGIGDYDISEKKEKLDDYPIGNQQTGNTESLSYTPDESKFTRLTIPTLDTSKPISLEPLPVQNTRTKPSYSISLQYETTSFVKNSFAVLNVWVENTGEAPIFVYKSGILLEEESWHSIDNRILVNPDSKVLAGAIKIPVPDSDTFDMRMGIAFFAQNDDGKWYDYDITLFDEQTASTEAMAEITEPEYTYNPPYMFDIINNHVTPRDLTIRKVAADIAKQYPGQYNIYQIIEIFNYTTHNVQYVSDPRGRNYWSYPNETIEVGAGDCEDYSTLISSLVEAVGGTTRLYLTDNHAFAAVYVGNDIDEISKVISEYYGSVPVRYLQDDAGSWLVLDPTSSMYVGDLPDGAVSSGDKWWFEKTSKVTVVDVMEKE